MDIITPEWVKHAVFYQIFPDRFARSQRLQPPSGLKFKPWGSPPDEQGFQGGDLYGIIEKLDYLHNLGITALYLNPIFASAANHRYHTYDYFQVDPMLGGNTALHLLLDEAHERGMRIVLDGVFNHASRGFWPFHHILENGPESPYIDWFIIEDWPLRPYQNGPGQPPNYAAWWGLPALPKLNTRNKAVQEYIFEIAAFWVDFGIDGWRLDVPMEIDDDAFWRHFRHVVKAANPDAYICGEVWENAQRWLRGDQFDAVMNYIFSWATMSFTGARTLRMDYKRNHLSLEPRNAEQFGDVIDYMHGLYDWNVNHVQLNLLGSHDTARALWIMGEDKTALRLSAFLQMTMPGAPCIYYGDEIGLSAGDDPYCRAAFPWRDLDLWDHNLLEYYRRLIALRHENEVLRVGSYERIYAKDAVFAFKREWRGHMAFVLLNTEFTPVEVSIPLSMYDAASFDFVWPVAGNRLEKSETGHLVVDLDGRSSIVLIAHEDRE